MIEHPDVDAYRAALATWELDAVPLDRGPFMLRWVERALPDLAVVRYSTTRSLKETYVKEAGSTAIAMILPRSARPFRVRGASLEPLSLTLLRSGVEYEVISPAGGETLEVYLTDDEMVELGLSRWLDPEVLNVRPSAAYATSLVEHLSPLVTPGRALAQSPEAARARVLEALDAALDSADPSAPPVPTVRLHATYRRAVAIIDDEPELMLSVVTLARRLDVTTRTLRYAFGYALGISPYQYLLRRRLTIAREALLDPERAADGILEVLLGLGISHQGEFAGQYRRLFGETPRETRKRAMRRPSERTRGAGWPRIGGNEA